MANIEARPYVYKLTHKETGQFYIGYREANLVQSKDDLGFYYFTSSDAIMEMGFSNFDYEIIKEFDSGDEAYDLEQNMIKLNFYDILCLNKYYFIGADKRFKHTGVKHTESAKQKMIDHNNNRSQEEKDLIKSRQHKSRTPMTDANKNKIRAIGKSRIGSNMSQESRLKMKEAWKTRKPITDETREKMRLSRANRDKILNINQGMKVSKYFRIVGPNGCVHEGRNLKQYCVQNNISYSTLSNSCRDGEYKGWKGEYING